MHTLSDTIERKFVDSIPIDDWQIESEGGWFDITSLNVTVPYQKYILKTTSCHLECADDHIVFDYKHNEVFVKDLSPGDVILGQFGNEVVLSVEVTDDFENMYDLSVEGNHTYYAEGLLHHNTQTVAAYILHYVLFNENKNVAILANKATAAREIMSRFQLMYEYLPVWLQQGITTWNKGDIELENGSKVFTAATSASGIRGKSCVTKDTRVCILENDDIFYVEIDKIIVGMVNKVDVYSPKKYTVYKTTNSVTGKIYIGFRVIGASNILSTEFGNLSCYSDGYLGSSVLLKVAVEKYGPENFGQEILGVFDVEEYGKSTGTKNPPMKILSSDGFKDFDGFINQGLSKTLYLVKFESGNSIKVTGNHQFMLELGDWITADCLTKECILFGDTVSDIVLIENELVYDALEVDSVHNYYTNGVISHNCNFLYVDEAAIIQNTVAEEFFTSTYPTISAGKTTKIVLTSTPLGYNHWWKFWNDSVEGRNGFVPVEITYDEHPERDEDWARKQRELLGELKYSQEVECVSGETMIELLDTETGEVSNISIASAYSLLHPTI